MATRFYFPASTAAAVSPSFASAGWGTTSGAVRRKAVTTKGSSAIGVGSTQNVSGSTLDRQYVSDPLAAQTILGTATGSGSLMMRQINVLNGVDTTYICVYLVSNDGSTVRDYLFNLNAYGTFMSAFTTAASCRNTKLMASATYDVATYGSTGGSISVTAGDRLVIEIGAGVSGSGTSPQFECKWGENASDLPVDDEAQTSDGAGWFELSQTLTFGASYVPQDPLGRMGMFGL